MEASTPTRLGLEHLTGIAGSPDLEPLPSLLRTAPERWVRPIAPADANLDRLNIQLQLFLVPDGLLLLQACAVYPQLAWNITLTLATELLPVETRDETLSKIVALPWFRHGVMPDWLRVRLLAKLAEEEPRVRNALRAYLDQHVSRVSEREEALEFVPGKPLRSSRKLALNDYIYLSFVSGKRLDRLSVEAPPKWRKFLQNSVRLRLGCAIACVGLAWPITGWAVHRLDKWVLAHTEGQVSIQLPANPFARETYLVALGLESPPESLKHQVSNDALTAFAVASTLLAAENPIPSTSALPTVARKASNGSVQPGMIVEIGNSLRMVKAERKGLLLLFGVDNPIERGELDLYDVSKVAIQPQAQRSGSGPELKNVPVKVPGPQPNQAGAGVIHTRPPGQEAAKNADLQIWDRGRFKRAAQAFARGFGEFHFGMSPSQVSDLFRDRLPSTYFENLIVAPEYKTAEVRYYWVRLSELQSATRIGDYLSWMDPWGSCMQSGSQSYIVFLFVKGDLVRISSRFLSDCPQREDRTREFIKQLGIQPNVPLNAHHLTINIRTTNLTWTIAAEQSFFDVWKGTSPKPLDSFGLEGDQAAAERSKR
jgi:hypothetical protein